MGKRKAGKIYDQTILGISIALVILNTMTYLFGIRSSIISDIPGAKYGPLSTYLRLNGIGNDKTLFLSMASKEYIEPVINFRKQLNIFGLAESYVVLCLDTDCVEATKKHHILGYDGFLVTEAEAQGDWHDPIARMKVTHL
jgi:hypothetical protein